MKKLAFLIGLMLTFSISAQITSVPFELFGDHIIIQVSVDDSEPLDFIFDTGSGYTVLDFDVAEDLHLVKEEIRLNEVSTSFHLIKHNTLKINDFLMEKNIKVYATDLDHLEISLGRDIDGIVGYDLMHHHAVEINYDTEMMHIYELGKAPKTGDRVPFTLHVSIPTIKGMVVLNNEEPHDGTFFVMTGAGTTMDFNSPYAEEYDVIHKTGKHYSYLVKGITQEETPHYEGHVLSLTFGKQKIEDLPIGISTANHGIQADKKVSGIIGSQVLRMFNFTIDKSEKAIYFRPNEHFGKEFNVNCSGIDMQLSKDKSKVLIHQVFEDSPADEAGIQLDDELISINGESISSMSLARAKKMLRKEGETVSITIKRNGAEKSYDITLRSLIE